MPISYKSSTYFLLNKLIPVEVLTTSIPGKYLSLLESLVWNRCYKNSFPYALCGVSGGSVMIGALRTSRGHRRNIYSSSFLHSSHGLRGGWPCEWLIFLIFFLYSPLSPNPLCIFPMDQRLRPSTLLFNSIDFSKKKTLFQCCNTSRVTSKDYIIIYIYHT